MFVVWTMSKTSRLVILSCRRMSSMTSMLVVFALFRTSRLVILPADVKDGTESTRMELIQLFEVPALQYPGLTLVKERCENKAGYYHRYQGMYVIA